jgi:hypothetical protein
MAAGNAIGCATDESEGLCLDRRRTCFVVGAELLLTLTSLPVPSRGQLQSWQRPVAQEHAGSTIPARSGRQRRNHSKAARSVRSSEPPGQQNARAREVTPHGADFFRPATDSMCWRSSL